jgi:hypothetical protein
LATSFATPSPIERWLATVKAGSGEIGVVLVGMYN